MKNTEIKDYYNSLLKTIGKTYEEYRWFKNEIARFQYIQTEKVIIHHLENNFFKNTLEVGCGSGVWTKLLLSNSQYLSALDISEEMLKQAKTKIKSRRVRFLLGDFARKKLTRKYDLVFSCRALEYFEDKQSAIQKIYNILGTGGKVIIITKNPYFGFKQIVEKLLGKHEKISKVFPKKVRSLIKVHQSELQSDWISHKKLKSLMAQSNFKEIEIYPVVIGLTYSKFIWKIFNYIHKKIFMKRLNKILLLLTESYLIKGIKK